MSNLVKRLREGTNGTDIAKTDAYFNGLMAEAAEEIGELRVLLHDAVWTTIHKKEPHWLFDAIYVLENSDE